MEVQKKNFSSEIDTECLNTPTQSERSYNTNSNFDSFEESDSFEDSDYEDYYNNNLVGINDNYTDLYEKINEIISILGDKRIELNYPQIAVVGDQSSGKSSLLETIFNIKLPTASGTCTKCPIVIKSKKNLNLKEKKYYLESDKNKNYEEINEENVCEKIKNLQNKLLENGNLVSDKEIILQIEGSDLFDITIVDLPGIIHSGDNNDNINTIEKMIKNYIRQDNTIILVVNPANSDKEGCKAHKLAEEFDKKNKRTLTIYTKYDRFDSPEKEQDTNIIINKEDNSHAVICKPKDYNNKYDEVHEFNIFKENNISEEKSGIPSLKIRLEKMYCKLIKENAPNLKKKIGNKIYDCNKELNFYGKKNKEKSEIVRDIKNIFLNEFNKDNNTELGNFFNKFHINIKHIKSKEKNSIKTFVENNYKSDIFRVSCFQGEDTFNKRLQFICNMYTSNGFMLKEEIEKYLKKLFNNIKLDFIDENSSLIIFRYVNNTLDKIILNFEKELIKEINKERKFKTINHYFEDNKIYNELQNIIDSTTINNSLSKIEKIRQLCNNYKNLSLEQRQKQNIVDALTSYEEKTQMKNILDNTFSVINTFIIDRIKEWINDDLFEFIRNNDEIKEDDKIKEKRLNLNQDIIKYEDCLKILNN